MGGRQAGVGGRGRGVGGGSDCSVRLNPSGTAGVFLRKPGSRAAADNDKSVA